MTGSAADGEPSAAAPARPRLRLALIAVVLLGAALVASQVGFSAAQVRDAVGEEGAAAMLAFVAVYAALTVAMFPGSVVSLAGGAVFGAVLGTALVVAGATLGATVAFLIGRRLSRSSVEALAGGRLRRLEGRLARRGLVTILVLRLIPLVPFNALNYAAGATTIPPRQYVLGTMLGILPGAFAFAAAGAAAEEPSSPAFISALALLGVLVAVGAIGTRRLARSDAGCSEPTAEGPRG